jgi:hypothetical protein
VDTKGNGLGESKSPEQALTTVRRPTRSGQPAARVGGVLVEQVVVSGLLDPFLSLRALASYACVSVRKLRAHVGDPAHPLPHYRVGGKILVRRSEFDAWIAAYRRVGQPGVEGIVDSVMHDLSDT